MKLTLEWLRTEPNSPFKRERWVTLEEAHLLYALVQLESITDYFESGTANGYSACWAALAMHDRGGPGGVFTWDPANRPKIWDSNAELKDLGDLRVVYHEAPYAEGVTARAVQRTGRALFFIDGDHRTQRASEDLTATMQTARTGDIIVMHDMTQYPGIEGLWTRQARRHRASRVTTDRGVGVIWL